MPTPLVTIICFTYNHEKYISSAIESFLHQKTDFNYVIFIHDDASEDNTANIIKQFCHNHTNIIYYRQSENQYSKGVETNVIFNKYIKEYINTKYIALCQGDDYWCDDKKLQKCVDFLNNNNDYVGVCHNTNIFDCTKNKDIGFTGLKTSGNVDYTFADALNNKCHYSSFVIRSKEYLTTQKNKYSSICHVEDYFLKILILLEGKVRYIDKIMSTYRYFSSKTCETILKTSQPKKSKIKYIKKKINFFFAILNRIPPRYKPRLEKLIYENIYEQYLISKNVFMFVDYRYLYIFLKNRGKKKKTKCYNQL